MWPQEQKMKKHKITLLDLGGVVFQSSGISNKKIDWKIINSLNYKYGHELNIGENKFPMFLAEYNQRTKQRLSKIEFLKEVFDTLKINAELIEIIKAKTDIIIVSDNYRENINYISKRYEFEKWSTGQIYSYDYKMVKSNPDFFKKLLSEWPNYHPEEMLFIDDSREKIESAEESGIRGILYQSNEQIKNELDLFGH